MNEKFACKCCGRNARWCGEGPASCGNPECDHIHCDYCGMHYSFEHPDAFKVQTLEEARAAMRKAYNGQ